MLEGYDVLLWCCSQRTRTVDCKSNYRPSEKSSNPTCYSCASAEGIKIDQSFAFAGGLRMCYGCVTDVLRMCTDVLRTCYSARLFREMTRSVLAPISSDCRGYFYRTRL
ncbi:hypothetical protein J6590_100325 [Homalodisca vitripennis]|nr:hypothetical protein J6590_100325 [Homalodisca vitripennis]